MSTKPQDAAGTAARVSPPRTFRVIRDDRTHAAPAWFCSIDGDNAMGPFRTEAAARHYGANTWGAIEAPAPAPPLFACDMQTPPAPAGRTVAEVRNDPAFSGLFAEAAEHFRQAEESNNLAEIFEHFRQGVRIMRTINAAELRTQGAAL